MTKRSVLELGKDIAIVLLALLAAFLLLVCNLRPSMLDRPVLGRLLAPAARLLHMEHTELPPLAPAQTSAAEAARPVAISMRNAAGRSSVMADADALEAAYLQFGVMLGEALDTCEAGVAVSEAEYQAALGEPGVCFLYQTSMPVGTLGSWLGAQTQLADCTASQLLLRLSGGEVTLYLAGDAGCFRAATRARGTALQALLDPCLPDGSAFAFETEDAVCAHLAPLTLLLLNEPPRLYALSVTPASGAGFSAQVLTSLGINAYGANAYEDASGAALYNESGFSLRIGGDGTVDLLSSGDRFLAESETLTARIELARSLLDAMTTGQTGAGLLQLSGWSSGPDGALTATFDYFVGGVPVALAGHAATAVFYGRRLETLAVSVRCYTPEAQTLPLLPTRQAAALVADGSGLHPGYADVGGVVSAGWQTGA